ncbi:Xaa-Pro aminopeptidase [Entomoplasma freundtii]|uniref:Xaa-Pro dipeptidase n=2 Tax=Entomoplasma freundtii TaxID=74700 RepID=A0A2K8NR84_9MOLU|nr:Xaa-Pro dipeptidase [Entomoplasma freundtii]TDY56619.1 Xaa-Pro aminopeptidase [Entomoplasma freundtii]
MLAKQGNSNTNLFKIRQLILDNNIDAILLTSKQNRYWATGFLNSSGYLYVDLKRAILFVDGRYKTDVINKAKDCEVFIVKNVFEDINQEINKFGIQSLGIESEYLTNNFIEMLQEKVQVPIIKPVSVRSLRMVKTKLELAKLAKAAEIGDKALIEVLRNFKLGKTEDELENEIFASFIKQKADKIFPRVVLVSGERGCLPHGKPTDKVIHEGELLTIDFGCVYDGYCSDMTRTVAIGEVSEELRKIYQIVKEAQAAGIRNAYPGITGAELHKIVWNVIDGYGYADYFVHQTGHGIGLEVHEAPRVASYDNTILEENMVVTIEPGIYIPGVGGVRIEDMVQVTKDGGKCLTKLNNELINILGEELNFAINRY